MIKPIAIRAELKYPKWVQGPKGDPAYQLTIDEEGNLIADNGRAEAEEEEDNGED